MFKLNFILYVIFISLLNCAVIRAAVEKSKNVTVQIGAAGLKDLLNNLNELKISLCDQESSKEKQCPGKEEPKTEDLLIFDERVKGLPENCHKTVLPSDCASATECVQRSGIYKIQVGQFSNEPFYVGCDAKTDGGDWVVVQRRVSGAVDFHRNWTEYENGFGEIDGDFFIGLKKLHALTSYNGPQELMVVMENSLYQRFTAKYDLFSIANEMESYKIKRLGRYSGNAGDSLRVHFNMKFTTKDTDNDLNPFLNCAVECTGGWWYNNCHHSNLNGKYGDIRFGKGINWFTNAGYSISLPYVKMMIRRIRVV